MRTWLLVGALAALAGCGGNVVVDTGGGGAPSSTSTGTVVGCPGGGGMCANSCADAINTGSEICASDIGTTAYLTFNDLVMCAGTSCEAECATICSTGVSTACLQCVQGACPSQIVDCEGN